MNFLAQPAQKQKLQLQMAKAQRNWRAAARRATEASFRYHYIRVLGATARRTLVAESSQLHLPEWAVALRNWEGGLKQGAAQRASIECLRASRNYHIASAHREQIRWQLTDNEMERAAIKKKYEWHVQSVRRASRRLISAIGHMGGEADQ